MRSTLAVTSGVICMVRPQHIKGAKRRVMQNKVIKLSLVRFSGNMNFVSKHSRQIDWGEIELPEFACDLFTANWKFKNDSLKVNRQLRISQRINVVICKLEWLISIPSYRVLAPPLFELGASLLCQLGNHRVGKQRVER